MTTDLPAPGSDLELICLWAQGEPIRARLVPHGPLVVVRTGISKLLPIEGEIFTVAVRRSWVFGSTRYVSGEATRSQLDVARLALQPIALHPMGTWDPAGDGELDQLPRDLTAELSMAGPRACYEMEQILPGESNEPFGEDPIVEAADLISVGDWQRAGEILGDLLLADLRCLDAHAHLGLIGFQSSWPYDLERAARHYQTGVGIGDAALGTSFEGLLPWGLIDNRPFLRCLHGLGLCHWRAEDDEAAIAIFRRLLFLDPNDNLGVRFLLPAVTTGEPWKAGV